MSKISISLSSKMYSVTASLSQRLTSRQLDVDPRFFAGSKLHALSFLVADSHTRNADRAGIVIRHMPFRGFLKISTE